MSDKKWISIHREQPNHNEVVSSRISYQSGYHSNTTWDLKTRTFRTYEDKENRYIITIWKHDEWSRNR